MAEALIAAGADRRDGAAVPGQLAQHADHRPDHPAVDPGVHPGAVRAGRDAQPDDAGRAGAVGRHPGRPGDRHHREHRAPPAPGQAAARGHRGRRRRDRRARRSSPRCASASCSCRCSSSPGVARFLFVPLAEAVVFAMLASYFLSRTPGADAGDAADGRRARRRQRRAQAQPAAAPVPRASTAQFERLRRGYALVAVRAAGAAGAASACLFLGFCAAVVPAVPGAGPRLLPDAWTPARSGCTCARPPAPASRRRRGWPTRSRRRSASWCPRDQLETILDNLGVPNSGINLSYSNAGTIGTLDGEILLSLREGHRPTERLGVAAAAPNCPSAFPGVEFFFQPADIVTQILNFGLPAAIDVQFSGARPGRQRGARGRTDQGHPQDPRRGGCACAPAAGRPRPRACRWTARACSRSGLSATNVGQNVLIALSGSSQTAPAFWLNPQNGVVYNVVVQTPQYQVDSLDSLLNIPVGAAAAAGRRQHAAAAGQPGRGAAAAAAAGRLALQHRAGDRRLRQRAGHRPGQRRVARCRTLVDADAAQAPARQPGRHARPGADHAVVVHRPGRRAWRWRSCWSTC